MKDNQITLSPLGHTWILDLDGTLLIHNGHKTQEGDQWVPGAREFLMGIPSEDLIIIVTSRSDEFRESTERFLHDAGVRYDHIIFNAPYGERIIINDTKPSGLSTAVAIKTQRDKFLGSICFTIDSEL